MVLSPSKTLDYETPHGVSTLTQPALLEQSCVLIEHLRGMSEKQLSELMEISPKLAALNAARYRDFKAPFTQNNARPALLAFKGDVYESMRVAEYTTEDFSFAQSHLRILSGLYGVLRPLDLMQPYRLEMGTRLGTLKGKDLYAFWGEQVTQELNHALAAAGGEVLLNLASEEYFKAVRPAALKGRVLSVLFRERRGNKLQTIGLYAKKARGMMADYVIRHRLSDVKALKKFKEGGYAFDPALSGDSEWVFIR